jgi:hypothetical protein
MMVLFLGGPWHNERHEVLPGRSAAGARSLPTWFRVPLAADEAEEMSGPPAGSAMTAPVVPRPRRHVTYTRRFARSNGVRLPVYVSPEYQGPARA